MCFRILLNLFSIKKGLFLLTTHINNRSNNYNLLYNNNPATMNNKEENLLLKLPDVSFLLSTDSSV